MIEKIIKNKTLTSEQKVISLAREAENSIDPLNKNEELRNLIKQGIICDLFEGNAPYRPRYILPDFELLFSKGSEFLNLTPPSSLIEAIHTLLIFYKHIPSITTMPVYLGNIDYLLEPFIIDEKSDYIHIKLFLKHIDSTITDSFTRANIGPKETKAGKLILKAIRELNLPSPNLTLKYNEETPKDFAITAINSALEVAKPSFANDNMFIKDFKGNYGIASCYNGLKIGGGAFTLVRIKLGKASELSNSIMDFLDNVLPKISKITLEYIDERSKYILNNSNFFESNFLSKEGFIDKEKFTGLLGIVGLSEAVNHLMKLENKNFIYGKDIEANELALSIIQKLNDIVNNHHSKYAGSFFSNHHLLHSQVGIDTDINETPGCRIPIGEEPEIFEHILQSAPFHKYFPSGIGDIFVFNET